MLKAFLVLLQMSGNDRHPEERYMRFWGTVALIFLFSAATQAQYISPAADFFLYDRFYDTFLRDHFRFREPKPLRVEYWNINWLDSGERADEYKDYLHFEGRIPIYTGAKLMVEFPFQYRHVPLWAESDESTLGKNINVVEPELLARWTFTERLKAIFGWEYNLKGDGDTFGKSVGREICFLEAFLSYDLHPQLNLAAGARLDRYYYDTGEEPDIFKLTDRLYYHPAIMLNWHPGDNFIFLLGFPGVGAHLGFGEIIKIETRVAVDKEAQIALSVRPVERLIATLRFLKIPYMEIPTEIHEEGRTLTEMLCYTDKNALFEIGWKLNPAALASVGFRYSPGGDIELRDRANENIIKKLDGKSSFAVGATFTMSIEALLGMR